MAFFEITKTVFKSLFGKPETLMYPVIKREFAKGYRGSIKIEQEKCIYCGICQKKCPTQAIVVDRPSKLWKIDPFRCITCNACVDNCPKDCLIMDNHYTSPVTVVEKNKIVN